jgi:hypothetical protein
MIEFRFAWRSALLLPLLFLMLLVPAGCNYIAAAAALTPVYQDAKYKGLSKQSVGVMVWADRGVSIDWPTIQLDTAGSVESKLQASQKAKVPELEGTTWPVLPASIVRYQRDHPEIEAYPIADIAPRLGVTRLIYIEIQEFRTRSETAVELFRGSMSANVKILEIANGHAKVGYEEDGVRVIFPRKSLPEGALEGQDVQIYGGVLDEFSDALCERLIRHEVQEGEDD